jgi:hypothetical protein
MLITLLGIPILHVSTQSLIKAEYYLGIDVYT